MSGSDEELPAKLSESMVSPLTLAKDPRRGSANYVGNHVGTGDGPVDAPDGESLDEISRCLREAGFDHVPAYSVLREEQDYGGADGLRRIARAIREVHGGIYRTAAKLWTEQRGAWEFFPADPIPRRVLRARDGEVLPRAEAASLDRDAAGAVCMRPLASAECECECK